MCKFYCVVGNVQIVKTYSVNCKNVICKVWKCNKSVKCKGYSVKCKKFKR